MFCFAAQHKFWVLNFHLFLFRLDLCIQALKRQNDSNNRAESDSKRSMLARRMNCVFKSAIFINDYALNDCDAYSYASVMNNSSYEINDGKKNCFPYFKFVMYSLIKILSSLGFLKNSVSKFSSLFLHVFVFQPPVGFFAEIYLRGSCKHLRICENSLWLINNTISFPWSGWERYVLFVHKLMNLKRTWRSMPVNFGCRGVLHHTVTPFITSDNETWHSCSMSLKDQSITDKFLMMSALCLQNIYLKSK